jgi:hypothetical protein
MNRRKVLGVIASAAIVVVGVNSGAELVRARATSAACACCNDTCLCPACVCDARLNDSAAGHLNDCDCCGPADCCADATEIARV